jgi:2-keto-4-pentenoate hydratase/2-oxohepta-3-ene-1,7-dioic acid hydratase in catechol pathway
MQGYTISPLFSKPETSSYNSRPFPSKTSLDFPLTKSDFLAPLSGRRLGRRVSHTCEAKRPEWRNLILAPTLTTESTAPPGQRYSLNRSRKRLSVPVSRSAQDIEGENLLYLPQAKIYHRSCAIGPCIVVGSAETVARTWLITLQIHRGGRIIFEGQTGVNRIKRSFEELVSYLYRSQTFPYGAVLLTGTGIVPGNDFTLQPDDRVRIEVNGIGVLENTVIIV